jgi:FAD/FMN-containing dehydrogenase
LYWALRGGGGNFGVVTEFELNLHPLTSVLLAEGLTPEPQVRVLLERWRELMPGAPHDLKWNINLRLAPQAAHIPLDLRGLPVATSALVWTADPASADRHLQPALSLCRKDSDTSKVLSFLDLQTMADADFPHGRRYYTKSGYFTDLEDETISRLIVAMETIPSAETQIELAYLGGAAGQVAAHETAFGDRSAPFVLTLLANWLDASDDARHIAWVRQTFQDLRPKMKPGVYVNFMSGDEQDRVPEAYRERWDRMVAIKSHYDPKNFFRLNQNVPPQAAVSNRKTAAID